MYTKSFDGKKIYLDELDAGGANNWEVGTKRITRPEKIHKKEYSNEYFMFFIIQDGAFVLKICNLRLLSMSFQCWH